MERRRKSIGRKMDAQPEVGGIQQRIRQKLWETWRKQSKGCRCRTKTSRSSVRKRMKLIKGRVELNREGDRNQFGNQGTQLLCRQMLLKGRQEPMEERIRPDGRQRKTKAQRQPLTKVGNNQLEN